VLPVVEDLLGGDLDIGVLVGCRGVAGVGVPVPAREVAAGDFQPDGMAGPEDRRGAPGEDAEWIDFAGLEEDGVFPGLPVLGPEYAGGEVDSATAGVHVNEPGGEVRVRDIGGDEELHGHRAGNGEGLLERRGGIDQHLVQGFDRPLVGRPHGDDPGHAAGLPAQAGYRVPGVVDVDIGGLVTGGIVGEEAVAIEGIGQPAAVEVEGYHAASRRPLPGLCPCVLPEPEVADRRLIHDTVFLSLEPVVEPAHLQGVHPAGCLRPEVAGPGDPGPRGMPPGAHHQLLVLAGQG